jgi:hypothetical protein
VSRKKKFFYEKYIDNPWQKEYSGNRGTIGKRLRKSDLMLHVKRREATWKARPFLTRRLNLLVV